MIATLGELATLVAGRVTGNAQLAVHGAETLSQAGSDQISFLDHPRLKDRLKASSEAGAVVVPEDWPELDRPAIHVANVRDAFAKIVSHFHPPLTESRTGISSAASVDPTAVLGEDVTIHPNAVIGPEVRIGRGATIHANVSIMGRCQIGDGVTIYPGAVLYRDTRVGHRAVIHAAAVIGAYGFGYETKNGQHFRSDQLGYVVLEDDVEIGAGTTVDRGTYGPTIIGKGTKIDNLVQIAHNCRIGQHNMICSQVGIAGSSSTGDYVVMAGQVGVPDHVRIGHQAVLGAKSGVMRDVPDGMTMLGIPATPERDQMAKQAALAKLPEMRRQLRALRRQVEKLASAALPEASGDETVERNEAA